MADLYSHLITQLDGLVVLLAAPRREVFDFLKEHEADWLAALPEAEITEVFEDYQIQLVHAAFLLGYAYFEAFLADLAKAIYLARPKMLPKNKDVKYDTVISASSYDDLIRTLVELEVRSLFSKKIEDIAEHFREKLQLDWPATPTVVQASRLRNCLMHNNAVADERLAAVSAWQVGHPITLDVAEVHSLGLDGRKLAQAIHHSATERHFQS